MTDRNVRNDVVGGETKPERMRAVFKSYATRALCAKESYQRERFWADHRSTRYLWNEMSLKAAVEYVLNGQGRRLECFPDRFRALYASGSDSELVVGQKM